VLLLILSGEFVKQLCLLERSGLKPADNPGDNPGDSPGERPGELLPLYKFLFILGNPILVVLVLSFVVKFLDLNKLILEIGILIKLYYIFCFLEFS